MKREDCVAIVGIDRCIENATNSKHDEASYCLNPRHQHSHWVNNDDANRDSE